MSRSKIPEEFRASFLHEEDDLEELILGNGDEEKDTGGVDYERLLSIVEDGEESPDKKEQENEDFLASATSLASTDSISATPMTPHRMSADTFVNMCKSFRVTSPHKMASMAASGVKERFRESLSESLMEDYNKKDCIAPFSSKEIVLGKKLGSGEFSHVYLVKAFRLDNNLVGNTASEEEMDVRKYMKGREKYRDTNKSSYALKHLRPELLEKYENTEYAQFASDLVQEAEFLSMLQHPNIIKLRGTSADDWMGFEQGPKGYFLIIDRLEDTLDNRIVKWKKGGKGSFIKTITRRDSEESLEKDLLPEQLEVLLQIAAAFVYLHERNIIFRDLKPANVGFDVRGDVKLFDFGLAKMMPADGDCYNEPFEMSGAGSPRYMAPEVLGNEPMYNLKADVYTFGILMWEVLSLKKPFAFTRSMAALVDHVVSDGGRPQIDTEWPYSIKDVLQMTFETSPDERPQMDFILETIRSQLKHMRDGDDSKLRNSYLLRRRSMASMRNLQGTKKPSKARQIRSNLAASITKLGRQLSLSDKDTD